MTGICKKNIKKSDEIIGQAEKISATATIKSTGKIRALKRKKGGKKRGMKLKRT